MPISTYPNETYEQSLAELLFLERLAASDSLPSGRPVLRRKSPLGTAVPMHQRPHHTSAHSPHHTHPSSTSTTPPQPRLVGIELNPGPTHPALAAALAKYGNGQGKTKTIAKRRRKAPRAKQAAAWNPAPASRMVTAPATAGRVTQSAKSVANFRIPFRSNAMAYGVATNGAGYSQNIVTALTTAGQVSGKNYPQILNLTNPSASSNSLVLGFGTNLSINLFRTFSEYRITNLRFEVNPLRSSGTSGSYAVAFSNEAGVATAATSAYSDVASMTGSITSPVWSSSTLRPSDVSKDWKICDYEAASASDPEFRQCFFGALFFATLGCDTPASDTLLTSITVVADIEFRGRVDAAKI